MHGACMCSSHLLTSLWQMFTCHNEKIRKNARRRFNKKIACSLSLSQSTFTVFALLLYINVNMNLHKNADVYFTEVEEMKLHLN